MKLKKYVLPVLFLIFGIFITSAGLIYADVIHFANLNEIIDVGAFGSLGVKSNYDIINELSANNSTEVEMNVPDEVNALWLDLEKDFKFDDISDVAGIKSAVYNDLLFYKNFLPNAYFLKPDSTGKYDSLVDSGGSEFDLLGYVTDLLNKGSADIFIVIDESYVYENGKLSFNKVKILAESYSFDGILFSAFNSEDINVFEIVEFLSSEIRKNFPAMCFGAEFISDMTAQFADDNTIAIFDKHLIDFGYVDIVSACADVDYPFYGVAMWWNYFAEYYNIPLYCEHRLDKIFGSDELWAYSNEINLQLTALYDMPAFDGSCYYNASQLKVKKALSRDLSIFLNDVAGTDQDDFFVSSMQLDNNKVVFSAATEVDDIFLYCNDVTLKTENNTANAEFVLTKGLNTFSFRGNAAEYDFEIYNNISLIYQYSPNSENTQIFGDTFVCSVVAPEESIVYTVFNGSSYEMSPDNTVNIEAPYGYCAYSVIVDISESKNVSDLISFVCFSGDKSQIVHQYVEFVNKKNTHQEIAQVTYNVASPYYDNGLGRALMCVIKDDHTETISEVDDYDTYHPYKSKLLKGTVDYVEKINLSAEGYIRYELKSGLNVYADDALLITDGYVLPQNNAQIFAYDGNTDRIQIKLDWLSPVNVEIKNLDFKIGYEQFSYNVSEFDAEYVDVNLYYCDDIAGINNIDLTSSCLFSSYEIIKSSDSFVSIRFKLKNPGMFFGYKINVNNEGIVEIDFNMLTSDYTDKVIMLDAGHGGISMVGTALSDDSASEAQITLAIAYKTKVYLEAKGFSVIMTRTDDVPLNLSERMELCENYNPDLFISIHCDGSASASESGTHTFYYTPFSQPLASSIHDRIVATYLNDIYVEADNNYSRVDRKIKFYPFYVTRVDNCPSVLIETGFLTNYVEGYVLVNPINQELIANSIAEGICDYFNGLN